MPYHTFYKQKRKTMITTTDTLFLQQAMEIAEKGAGRVNPNPLVGAVIVRKGTILAEGYHTRYGSLHAEREAFADADRRNISCEGATIYVTLEPCCHHGKQPPCTEAIIEHKVSRVVVGLTDPNPVVAGHGLDILREAGIEVEVLDTGSPLVKELMFRNRVFLKYITKNIPWITMKYAMTLDGKICTASGESKWITGEQSRAHVHLLRRNHMAIVCGIGTVLADNPMLDTRIPSEPDARNPIRIILDSSLRTPLSSRIALTAKEIRTIIVHSKQASEEKKEALRCLGIELWEHESITEMALHAAREKIDSMLVEGGGTINEAFVKEGLVDEVWAFIAPKIVGGERAKTPVEGTGIEHLSAALCFSISDVHTFGEDVCIHGIVRKENT